MPALRPVLAALVVSAPLLLAACSDQQGTGDLQYVPGDGAVVEYAAADREGPVELAGDTVDGGSYDLADHRGSVVVVNVWWSGCGPCITEMPMLTELHAAYGEDVDFVGINIRDTSEANAAAFERDRGVDYPSIYSPDGQALLGFPGRTAPRWTPTTVVIDPDGKVASLVAGALPSRTTLTDLVESAGGPSAPAASAASEDGADG